MTEYKKSICIDFDGVIHSYVSGWKGIDVIPDPPVAGAKEALEAYIDQQDFKVLIYSSRSKDPKGVAAMQKWLRANLLSPSYFSQVEFPTEKPAAWITIDDRGFHFQGAFPSPEHIRDFVAWNKGGTPWPPLDFL